MELWSSICDEEIFLKDIEEEVVVITNGNLPEWCRLQAKKEGRAPPRQSQNFIRQALGFLIPLLTEKIAAANQQLVVVSRDAVKRVRCMLRMKKMMMIHGVQGWPLALACH